MTRTWLPIASLALLANVCYADVDSARQGELMHLLKQDCGSCHGMTLKGGLGPALLPEALQGKSTAFIVSTILEGRAGTAMPPWNTMLNEDEASWIAQQLQRGVQ
jgi:cytochrome c55X